MRNKKLQASNQFFIARFSPWITHMLTLTLHESKKGKHVINEGWAKGAVNSYESDVNEKAALSSIRYFVTALNYKLYGRKTKRESTKNCCRIIAIPVLEGVNGNKRLHIHILLGNVPKNEEEDLEQIIRDVWSDSKWGMPRMKLDEIYDDDGVAFYLAKEVGYLNNDAVCWELASIPGRLIGNWS